MGRFAGISEARVSKGGVYILPGNYIVEIQRVKSDETRKGDEFFVVECKVVESNNPDRRAGSEMSWLVMLDKDASMGNIKQFCSAVGECDEEEVDEASVEMIVSEKNPLAGTLAKIQATNIKTRAGKDFTKVVWASYAAA